MIKILSLTLFCFFGLAQPKEEAPDDSYAILFTKIDNKALVYVNGKLVYDSGPIDGNPELNEKFDLSKYLQAGDNEIKVQLYNGSELSEYRNDNFWEIRYEIFESGESIDFGYETSKSGSEGLVYEMVHSVYLY